MKKKLSWVWIIIIIIVLLVIFFVSKYNKMVTMRNDANVAWSQVENQYQRRFDLTPQLVDSVKQILKQEGTEDVYVRLAEARSNYAGASTVNQKVEAAESYDSALSRLLAVVENYPQLKANENIKDLQVSIEGTENRLAVERGRFNDTVGAYNAYIIRFPNNLTANMFGFDKMETFEAQEGSDTAPEVGNMFDN